MIFGWVHMQRSRLHLQTCVPGWDMQLGSHHGGLSLLGFARVSDFPRVSSTRKTGLGTDVGAGIDGDDEASELKDEEAPASTMSSNPCQKHPNLQVVHFCEFLCCRNRPQILMSPLVNGSRFKSLSQQSHRFPASWQVEDVLAELSSECSRALSRSPSALQIHAIVVGSRTPSVQTRFPRQFCVWCAVLVETLLVHPFQQTCAV